MEQPKHTPEPWVVQTIQAHGPFGGKYKIIRASEKGFVIVNGCAPGGCSEGDANIERIAVCVNAMKGVADPAEFRKQYDSLLAVCQRVLSVVDCGPTNEEWAKGLVAQARAAITKVNH